MAICCVQKPLSIILALRSLFVQYVGVDVIQAGIGKEDEEYISTLDVTYANIPLIVIGTMFFKKLFSRKIVSMAFATAIIAASMYVLFVYGKRGPMLWLVVNIVICSYLSSINLKKIFLLFTVTALMFFVFMDPIIDSIKDVLPLTGERIENTIKEGDTDGRFDTEDAKHSTYLIGLENFSRSPIWGYYFRLVTDYKHYQGVYAHNIFIEVLQTMGLLGFIPFMLFLLRAFNKCRKVFSRPHTANQMACLILFLCPFLQLQTSNSMLFKTDFWFFFYIVCCIDVLFVNPVVDQRYNSSNDDSSSTFIVEDHDIEGFKVSSCRV